MNPEFDYDLSPDQWETLKALRAPAPTRMPNRFVVESLIALCLAEMIDARAVLTPTGRSVLLRGSPRLLDLVA